MESGGSEEIQRELVSDADFEVRIGWVPADVHLLPALPGVPGESGAGWGEEHTWGNTAGEEGGICWPDLSQGTAPLQQHRAAGQPGAVRACPHTAVASGEPGSQQCSGDGRQYHRLSRKRR